MVGTLYPFKIETHLNPDWVRDNFYAAFGINIKNLIRQMQSGSVDFSKDQTDAWAEAYTDANGRENSVDADLTPALFDTDKYKVFDETTPFVVIEATSLTESDFAINDCLIKQFDTGKWVLYCTTGTDVVKRAQIYKTLFYGSDSSNARVTSTYITGLTVLKTNISRDIGKRAHLSFASTNAAGEAVDYDGTFVDTSTNTDCSVWGYVATTGVDGNATGNIDFAIGNAIINRTSLGTTDEIGTDTEADELDNPADVRLGPNGGSSAACSTRALILCSGDITWVANNETGTPTYSNVDYYTDESIPDFTDGTSETILSIITHDLPSGTFNSTISSAFGTVLVEDYEDGVSFDYKLINATEDSGWLNSEEISTFTAFTSEPTKFIVKLIPKTTSPTAAYPSIKGSGVIAR